MYGTQIGKLWFGFIWGIARVVYMPQAWLAGTKKDEYVVLYQGADKSLARPTSRCILFDGKNISFDASLVLYIYI